MADQDALGIDNDLNTKGSGIRWLTTVLVLIAMTVVTVAALHWYQPIRVFMDSFLGVEITSENTFKPEVSSTPPGTRIDTTDFIQSDVLVEPASTDQDSGGFQELLDLQDSDVPITISARDAYLDRGPFDSARFELQVALFALSGNGDLTLASDAIRHAHTVATVNQLNPAIVAFVDQALAEIDHISKLNLESVQDRLEEITTLIASMRPVDLENLPVPIADPESSFEVSQQTESQSFWGELSDGISSVYRVRRIDELTSMADDIRSETGAQFRLLLLIERARNDVQRLDFEMYRESLNEARTILDSFSHANSDEFDLIRDELAELVKLELTSPYKAIRSALLELTNVASTQTVDAEVLEP